MEDDSSNISQTSSEELHEASEKNRSTLNPLSENLKGKLFITVCVRAKILLAY